jgi:transposase
MAKVTTIAVDLGKRVFSLYWVDKQTGEIGARTMTRAKFEEFMRMREPSRVVLEAGGSAHYWGRRLARLRKPSRPQDNSSCTVGRI